MLGVGQPKHCHLPMGPLKGFGVTKAFPYKVDANPPHCLLVPSTSGAGDLLHLHMDPPMGIVNEIWFLWLWSGSRLGLTSGWPGWDFRPGSCMGGAALKALGEGWLLETLGTEVKWPEASSHSLAIPSTRKNVRPWGNVGSLPGSLLHQT